MVGWHHQFKGYESEQTSGDSEGQGSLACCRPWVAKSQTQLSDWRTMTGKSQYLGIRFLSAWKHWPLKLREGWSMKNKVLWYILYSWCYGPWFMPFMHIERLCVKKNGSKWGRWETTVSYTGVMRVKMKRSGWICKIFRKWKSKYLVTGQM